MSWQDRCCILKNVVMGQLCLCENKLASGKVNASTIYYHESKGWIVSCFRSDYMRTKSDSVALNPLNFSSMSPELRTAFFKVVNFSFRATEAQEVYSLGCLMYFLFCGKAPFAEYNTCELMIATLKRKEALNIPSKVKGTPIHYYKLMTACLHERAKKRPSLKKALGKIKHMLRDMQFKEWCNKYTNKQVVKELKKNFKVHSMTKLKRLTLEDIASLSKLMEKDERKQEDFQTEMKKLYELNQLKKGAKATLGIGEFSESGRKRKGRFQNKNAVLEYNWY